MAESSYKKKPNPFGIEGREVSMIGRPEIGYIINTYEKESDYLSISGSGYNNLGYEIYFHIEYYNINTRRMRPVYYINYINQEDRTEDFEFNNFHRFNTKLKELGFPEFKNVHVNAAIKHYKKLGILVSKYLPAGVIHEDYLKHETLANIREKVKSIGPMSATETAMTLASNPPRRILEYITEFHDRIKSEGSEGEYGRGRRRTKRRKHSRRKSRRHRR